MIEITELAVGAICTHVVSGDEDMRQRKVRVLEIAPVSFGPQGAMKKNVVYVQELDEKGMKVGDPFYVGVGELYRPGTF